MRLQWDRDIDLDGKKATAEGRVGPHVFVRGNKADTPHWMPLHPAAVAALEALRREPIIDQKVFPVRESRNPASRVSQLFAEVCVRAGVTVEVERNGEKGIKNRWSLHDLRRKANTDQRNRGAASIERAALLDHRITIVNEAYYEAISPEREPSLIGSLPTFGMTG